MLIYLIITLIIKIIYMSGLPMKKEQFAKEKLKNTSLIIKLVLQSEEDSLNNLFDNFIEN